MAAEIGAHFAGIMALARIKLTRVEIDEDIDPDRAILSIQGQVDKYRVVIKEVITSDRRRYAYYLLVGDRVVLGLDNHADRDALRLKYGNEFTSHVGDLIPHRHGADKTVIELTEPWTAEQFLSELDKLVAEADQDTQGG